MAFTFFFRDAQTLETLVDQALPVLHGLSRIRIWDAGCAHGPEPYTLAILLRERMSDFMFRNVRIHATDVDGSFANTVTCGVYPEGELKRIPGGLFGRYFRPAAEAGHFAVCEELRTKIEFAVHDLLSLKPIREGLSLIVCKNVLLHFSEAQRRDVLAMFHGALREGGLLATEHTQKMPESLSDRFEQVVGCSQVFRKRAGAAHQESASSQIHTHAHAMEAGRHQHSFNSGPVSAR